MNSFLPRTALALLVAGLATVSLAACDGSGSSSAGTAEAPAAAPAAGASTAAAAAIDVSAADLCAYLKKNVADWKAVGSEVGAMAQMTIGLADFYDGKGAVPDGADIDEKSRAQCPDVRTEVLRAAGIDSFTAL
ncbi:hypothetical protein GCM10020358_05130 [Amorphoplanes nipponensis]|uniref:Lipoprotein n=1 Tax=Actinoplanes nipponensis TaxID=135950 RepID=A0A919MI26_9ACTN|nr:hypothetical protein [Actinoplanes nipponensis]GIE50299.1 hypothetical protein Ani05nite_38330 [Actinoplanes nipponensis]